MRAPLLYNPLCCTLEVQSTTSQEWSSVGDPKGKESRVPFTSWALGQNVWVCIKTRETSQFDSLEEGK